VAEGLEALLERGLLKKADTIEELAEQMEVPVETFKATVERYTELANMGRDLDFGKVAFRLTPIDTPPFYALKGAAGFLTTINGLRINSELQVLDTEHRPIPGLYAAGDVSGSFFANDYPELQVGIALGRTLTFGYIAGQNAAAEQV
jgi:fumarate reductase flavoprotein subunit